MSPAAEKERTTMIRTHTGLLSAVSMAAFAAPTDAGSAPQADTPAPAADNAPKFYLATANLKDKKTATADTEVSFVVEAEDYKVGWEIARSLTRFGSSKDGAFVQGKMKAWTAPDRKTAMTMQPGIYTVSKVASLQDRSKKTQPVTIDELAAELENRGIAIPKGVAELMQEMRANPSGDVPPEARTGTAG